MDNLLIGQRIRNTRREQGKTLQNIAAEIGVARSTIQRYEAGLIANIKLPVLEAIAKSLGVNPEWLILKSEYKEAIKIPPILNGVQVAFSGGAGEGLNRDDIDMLVALAERMKRDHNANRAD